MKIKANTKMNELRGLFDLLCKHAPVLALFGMFTAAANAQISPSDDAYITSTKTSTNYGANASLAVQAPGTSSLIRFDLSGVPAGYASSNVAKATLKLYVSAITANGSFNVNLINSSWNESTITFAYPFVAAGIVREELRREQLAIAQQMALRLPC